MFYGYNLMENLENSLWCTYNMLLIFSIMHEARAHIYIYTYIPLYQSHFLHIKNSNCIAELKRLLAASYSSEMCTVKDHKRCNPLGCDMMPLWDVVTSVGAIGCDRQAKYLGIKAPQPTTCSFNLNKSCNQR